MAHAAVVVALDLPRVAPSWPEDDSLPCPLILVTTDDRETVRHLAGIRTSCAVFTDEVERRLARQLLRMALSDGRMILRESIRGRKMHVALMRTLLALVDMPLLEIRPSRRHTRRFPRTVGDLAERAGVSADYLRHLAVDARLPLGTILHRYAAIRAAESIAICTPQDVIAELFGYEDASGVRKLIRRNLGVGVRDLARLGIQSHYADLARLVGTHKTRDSHGTDR